MSIVRHSGRGFIFTPKDFVDLGSRSTVDSALSRLAAKKGIRRLSRGLYDYPKKHHLLGDLYPSMDDIAKTIAKDTCSHMQITGSKALYLLGLSTQVPAKTIYLTDGQSKDIYIGNTVLTLKHASSKVMAGAGSKAGSVLQAIRCLGKDKLNDYLIEKLSRQLNKHDKQALKNIARFAPGWTKPVIDKLLEN